MLFSEVTFIDKPEDSQLARAQGMQAVSPQASHASAGLAED